MLRNYLSQIIKITENCVSENVANKLIEIEQIDIYIHINWLVIHKRKSQVVGNAHFCLFIFKSKSQEHQKTIYFHIKNRKEIVRFYFTMENTFSTCTPPLYYAWYPSQFHTQKDHAWQCVHYYYFFHVPTHYAVSSSAMFKLSCEYI